MLKLSVNPRRHALTLMLAGGLLTSGVAQADSPNVVDLSVGELSSHPTMTASFQDDATPDVEGVPDVVDPYQQGATTQVIPESTYDSTPDYSEPQYAPIMPSEMTPGACGCCNTTCCTKEKKEAAMAKMKGAYGGVFYNNDFSYLDDPCYEGPHFWGDNLKGLYDGKLDIGGEARVRYHSENNIRGLGLTGRDDDFWLTRLRLFANYRVNEYFRLYGEYLYADSGGEFFNNRPIEENRGEIQNLFVDANLTENLTLRVGRQELLYGAQRLISPLDWANTRRTFEGVSGLYNGEKWNVDGFFVHPVNRNAATESKIDDANEDEDFYGVYATRKGLDIGIVDAYYLGYNNDQVDFDYHTIGSRVAGASGGGLLYEVEGGVQFGENSPGFGDHSAEFFTGGLGRKLNLGDWKPTVWFWYDYASGGDDVPAARGDDGFDHLFPLAHKYNGLMDIFGRRNLHDLNAQFITPIGDKVSLLLWYHQFYLVEDTTPYSVVMTPFNAANAAGDRDLGQEIDVLFNININPRNNVLVGYSHFNSGAYYEETPGVPTDADADFFYFQYQTQF